MHFLEEEEEKKKLFKCANDVALTTSHVSFVNCNELECPHSLRQLFMGPVGIVISVNNYL